MEENLDQNAESSQVKKEVDLPKRFDFLEHLGKIRDGVLRFAPMLYILGYIEWSIYAWKENLGFLPVLNSQYFIAGIYPFIVIVLSVLAIRQHYPIEKIWIERNRKLKPKMKALEMMEKYIEKHEEEFKNFMGEDYEKTVELKEDIRKDYKDVKKTVNIGRIFFFVSLINILFVLINGYILIYQMPMALGGAKPRYAYLDIKKSELSKDTANAILLKGTNRPSKPDESFIQSPMVMVYFVSKDSIMVKPIDDNGELKRIYEIKQGSIQSITWY